MSIAPPSEIPAISILIDRDDSRNFRWSIKTEEFWLEAFDWKEMNPTPSEWLDKFRDALREFKDSGCFERSASWKLVDASAKDYFPVFVR